MAIQYLMYEAFEVNKVLIIAPLRVAKNTWSSEILKWSDLNGLRYSIVVGSQAERVSALKADADIYIINRENLQWLIEDSGFKFDFDMVVIDELSSFKNHQSKRFKALIKVRPKIRRIVGLTGTPAPNSMLDLYAEFKVLDMGERLGRLVGQYRTNYFKPDKMNGPIVYSYKLLPGAEEKIYEKISDITISMTAEDNLDMPELITTEYPVYLSEEEKAKYEDMKKELVLNLPEGEVTAANSATLSNKLQQMANGAIYDDEREVINLHSRKLDAIEDIVEAANGKPIMIVYWYKHDYTRIVERLNKLGVRYQKIDTDESIRNWNAGKLDVALCHSMSSGHGLNLQDGGNTMVWYCPVWSLELYSQTCCRLYRQGQKAKTVCIMHIVTEGTIDKRIMKALSMKDDTQSALIDAVKAEL